MSRKGSLAQGALNYLLFLTLVLSVPVCLGWHLVCMFGPYGALASLESPTASASSSDNDSAARRRSLAFAAAHRAALRTVDDSEVGSRARPTAPEGNLSETANSATHVPPPSNPPVARLSSHETPLRGVRAITVAYPATPAERPSGGGVWPWPAPLIDQLRCLEETELLGDSPRRAIEEFRALTRCRAFASPDSSRALDALEAIAREAPPWRHRCKGEELSTLAVQAQEGVARRAAIWRELSRAMGHAAPAAHAGQASEGAIVAAAQEALRGSRQAAGWQDFLCLAEASQWACRGEAPPAAFRLVDSGHSLPSSRRHFAQASLRQIDNATLDKDQRALLQSPPIQPYVALLRTWAGGLDGADLLAALEQHDAEPSEESAGRLAAHVMRLRDLGGPSAKLANAIDSHYRGPNLRVAVSARLIERLLPEIKAQSEGVADCVLGSPVYGVSQISTKLQVGLAPHDSRWQVIVKATGNVAAETRAPHGVVTFYNASSGEYAAGALVEFDGKRGQILRTAALANTAADLVGMETIFDGVPLLGSLTRAAAMSQYESKACQAQCEAQSRVAARAEERLRHELSCKLASAETALEAKVYQPLEDLGLGPRQLALRTTSERLIVACRLGAESQLGAHTARPWAPGDSLMSMQLHESALNNLIERFDLAGRRFTLEELLEFLAVKFGWERQIDDEDLPRDVQIAFADRQPLRIAFRDGKATITVRIAELSQGRRTWRNFTVQSGYEPHSAHLLAGLHRESHIGLEGESLSFRDQLALRAIFSKAFSRRRGVQLVSQKAAERPALAGLAVRQLTVDHGWLALAIGEKTKEPLVAERPR